MENSPEYELWSSKAFNLIWLLASPVYHNPLLAGNPAPRDAVWVENPLPAGRWKWFWRVCPTFGLWACSAFDRATAAGAKIPEAERRAFGLIRDYLDQSSPGWEANRSAGLHSRVALPGEAIIGETAEQARQGLVPRWDGWEKHTRREATRGQG